MLPSNGESSTQSLADCLVGGCPGQGLDGKQVPQYFKGRDVEDFALPRR
jgi:hypothetical protein